MNARFWFTAGVLTGVSASALFYFVFRSPTTVEHAPVSTGMAAAGAAEAPRVGTGTASANGAPTSKAQSMEAATAGLEARLERNGGSADDWELLAKSYEFLGRPEAAARARQHVVASAGGQQSVAENGAAPGGAMPSASDVAKLTALGAMAPRSTTQESGAAAESGAAVAISGTVSIESSLASRVDRQAVLFIYAKAADSPGPPLAVLRLTANSWPVSFRLDDSLAMLPTRRLSQFQKVIVEARISRSGQATPATGDLYVTSNAVSPSSGQKLALVINHEIG